VGAAAAVVALALRGGRMASDAGLASQSRPPPSHAARTLGVQLQRSLLERGLLIVRQARPFLSDGLGNLGH
jgi:hypothetical protein